MEASEEGGKADCGMTTYRREQRRYTTQEKKRRTDMKRGTNAIMYSLDSESMRRQKLMDCREKRTGVAEN